MRGWRCVVSLGKFCNFYIFTCDSVSSKAECDRGWKMSQPLACFRFGIKRVFSASQRERDGFCSGLWAARRPGSPIPANQYSTVVVVGNLGVLASARLRVGKLQLSGEAPSVAQWLRGASLMRGQTCWKNPVLLAALFREQLLG